MSTKHIGKQTAQLASPPTITETFSVVGSKEGAGPLRTYFDEIVEDNTFGEDSWEKAESKFMSTAIQKVVQKASLSTSDIQYLLAGDLLNQCSSAHYAVRDTNIPFMGIYGACSTMAEGLGLAGLLVDGGFAEHAVATTSSHFCSRKNSFGSVGIWWTADAHSAMDCDRFRRGSGIRTGRRPLYYPCHHR